MSNSKRFYVYVHRRKTDGVIFYVGKGQGNRHRRFNDRSEKWKSIHRRHGTISEVVRRFDNEDCAYTYERILINLIGIENLANIEIGGAGGPSGVPAWNKKKVYCSNGMIFQSASDAAKWCRGYNIGICRCCWGQWFMYKGYAWSYDDFPDPPGPAKRTARAITNGERDFTSMAEAVEWLKLNGCPKAVKGHISQCCNGKRRMAYGYVWNFKG